MARSTVLPTAMPAIAAALSTGSEWVTASEDKSEVLLKCEEIGSLRAVTLRLLVVVSATIESDVELRSVPVEVVTGRSTAGVAVLVGVELAGIALGDMVLGDVVLLDVAVLLRVFVGTQSLNGYRTVSLFNGPPLVPSHWETNTIMRSSLISNHPC